MPENSGLDLSQAPSLREEQPPKGLACHRSFQFILDPTAAMAGLSHTANVLTVSMPCMREKCALWSVHNDCCGDLVQAAALDAIAVHLDSRGA